MFLWKNRDDSFFHDLKLDKYQRKVVLNNDQYLLVVAGAGSGKTYTIVGKIKYLIEKCHVNEEEILCLSFTNATVNNLKEKLNNGVDVFTFHKLALKILRDNHYVFSIINDDFLEYVVNEYFNSFLFEKFQSLCVEYFDYQITTAKQDNLKKKIISFIMKIKCNNLSIDLIRKKVKRVFDKKDKIFLIIALDILRIYDEELFSTRKIDFDDMIIKAFYEVQNEGIIKKYRYIIIDEYQDISYIRFMLIREMVYKLNAHLVCVGDDCQAIYGFSGSNVSLFLDFFKYFKGAKRIDLKNTYRNSYQLNKISLGFVLKNPLQLRKKIISQFLLKHPVVLVYYDNYLETYHNLINYLYLEDIKNLLILARYNYELDEIKEENKGLNIQYLTVHMSKGLEEDYVLLLKMQDSYMGFPSKIKEDDPLNLNYKEEIKYAEERRLFYVALTRCRKKIFILVPRKNPSIFIQEIRNQCVELLLK